MSNDWKQGIQELNYIFDRKQKRQFVGIFFLLVFSSIFEMLGISVLMPFLQIVLNKEAFLQTDTIQTIIARFGIVDADILIACVIGLVLLVYLCKNFLLVLSDYIQVRFRCNLQRKVSISILSNYMKQPYSYFVDTNSAEILRGATGDAASVKEVVNNIFKFCVEIFTIILIALYLIYLDPIMTLGLGAVVIASFYIFVYFSQKSVKKAGGNLRIADRRLIRNITESLEGIKEFTVMNKRKFLVKRCDYEHGKKSQAEINYHFVMALSPRVMEVIWIAGIILVVYVRVSLVEDVQAFITEMAMFAVAIFKVMPAIARVSQEYSAINFHLPGVHAIYSGLKNVNENGERELIEKQQSEIAFNQQMDLKDINWKYDGMNDAILEKANLRIRKNESVALIGKSGAGKSTIADIILGLLQPKEGSIRVDDIDIADNINSWRELIGYVPQRVFLLDDTIKNNIAFGMDEVDIDEKLLWEVIDKAQLRTFIEDLPEGLSTIVGERGVKLSGGQGQRIAIARALYREPQILVLDEATSALDTETESAVMAAIEKLHGSMTLIIIAHRLSTVMSCDKIYEVKNGKIMHIDKQEVLNKMG